MLQLPEIIDLDRYSIDDAASSARRSLVARCRQALEEKALCALPGFIRPTALASLVAEAESRSPAAYRKNNLRTPYGWLCNDGFPEDHPRSALHLNRCGFVMTHQLDAGGCIGRLFAWKALTDFVRDVLGFDTLYPSACPHLSLVVNVMNEDDELAWHFDTNDGVVSLLLQAPDAGGHFEYAPYCRSETDENYPFMRRLFSGGADAAEQPEMAPGTFVLFNGHRSCHRVTRIGPTARPRLIALLSYDREPGMVFPETSVRDLMTPTEAPYRGQASRMG